MNAAEIKAAFEAAEASGDDDAMFKATIAAAVVAAVDRLDRMVALLENLKPTGDAS